MKNLNPDSFSSLVQKWKLIFYLSPLIALIAFFFWNSLSYPLHDFSNSYFPALMAAEGIAPENIVFDIFKFNEYAWSKGYPEVLIDFYLNSPFTSTLFYPFALIEDAYFSKAIFNLISVSLFIFGTYSLSQRFHSVNKTYLLLLPILFFIPIRNHILFGQSYMLVFFLVVSGFCMLEDKRKLFGIFALSLAVFIKIFPIFYGLPIFFNKQWKALIYVFPISILFLLISFSTSGFSFWSTYLFTVLPNAILNESTIDYHSSAQSIEVLLKSIFVYDSYYNPEGLFDNYKLYKVFSWLIKSIILGLTIQLSFKHKNNLFNLLSIWIVALFLLQTRTATYAQILWIIPAFVLSKCEKSNHLKILFFVTLLLVCNFPFHWLRDFPIGIRFFRLWLTLILAIIFYVSLGEKIELRFILFTVILLLPLNFKVFTRLNHSSEKFLSTYILDKKENFMIYDFYEKEGFLYYRQLDRYGSQNIKTSISIESYDSVSCSITDNQVYFGDFQLTDNYALKKKAVLINGNEVYYLTDHHSRRAAYTIKKLLIR